VDIAAEEDDELGLAPARAPDPLLAALAVAAHVGAGVEMDVGTAETDEFRHAQ
jgi:ABC-type transporter Mla maintaining outer membrane lipid asymmetry permease subunit MlaE